MDTSVHEQEIRGATLAIRVLLAIGACLALVGVTPEIAGARLGLALTLLGGQYAIGLLATALMELMRIRALLQRENPPAPPKPLR